MIALSAPDEMILSRLDSSLSLESKQNFKATMLAV